MTIVFDWYFFFEELLGSRLIEILAEMEQRLLMCDDYNLQLHLIN